MQANKESYKMPAYNDVNDALVALKNSISNFRIGAKSLNTFKTVEEKYEDMQKRLNQLNARLVLHNSQCDLRMRDAKEPQASKEETLKSMQENAAVCCINNLAVKKCLYSHTVQAILTSMEVDQDIKEKIYACMTKIFGINKRILAVQQELEAEREKQLKLKIECQTALFNYYNFLREQEEIHSQILETRNPEIVRNKQKAKNIVTKICLMQKLITNFIAASNHLLAEVPLLVEMLKNHRETYNMEIISKIAHSEEKDSNS